MTAIWIIMFIIGIIIIIFSFTYGEYHYSKTDSFVISLISGIVLTLAGIICFFAVPITGYMEVDSTHWCWTVDVYTYSAVNKSKETGRKSTQFSAETAAKELFPDNAYNRDIEMHSGSKTVTDREWTDEKGNYKINY